MTHCTLVQTAPTAPAALAWWRGFGSARKNFHKYPCTMWVPPAAECQPVCPVADTCSHAHTELNRTCYCGLTNTHMHPGFHWLVQSNVCWPSHTCTRSSCWHHLYMGPQCEVLLQLNTMSVPLSTVLSLLFCFSAPLGL